MILRFPLHNSFYTLILSALMLVSLSVQAGGIALKGTRIIYEVGAKQMSISVSNTSTESSYMVQSWVEDSAGDKSPDFIVTPPLYVSGPGNENTLRLIYAGPQPKADRETVYYLNTKAIPSLDKEKTAGKNLLMLAIVTRIKLFHRPANLNELVSDAPGKLTFHREGDMLRINNPTPYYVTLAEMQVGDKKLPNSMVAPLDNIKVPLNGGEGSKIAFRTINDYGAVTAEIYSAIK